MHSVYFLHTNLERALKFKKMFFFIRVSLEIEKRDNFAMQMLCIVLYF